MFELFWQDLRHAVRTLRRAPGFTAASILTLTLGIGATTAVFSVVDAVLINPLPFPEPDRLVAVYSTNVNTDKNALSYPNFDDIRREVSAFERLAAWRTHAFTLTDRSQPEALYGQMVSSGFFETLRVPPVAGRTFRPDEDRLGATRVAMVGEDFWRRRFHGDPTLVGSTLTLNGRLHTVVGVAPSVRLVGARGDFRNDVYVPIGQHDDPAFRNRGINDGTVGLARLRDNVALGQARAAADVVALRLAGQYPDHNRGVGVHVLPLAEDLVGDRRTIVLTLFAAVCAVLLIACANVSNLLLARSSARRHDTAVRAALGASRGRLVAQCLAESVVVSAAGGLAGVVLAIGLLRGGLTLLPDALPAVAHVRTNITVLAFAAGIALLTTLLVGLLPGVRAGRLQPQAGLATGARGLRGDRGRSQQLLVIGQLACTVVLLVGAGLLLRSLTRVWAVDPGLNPRGVITFRTALSQDRSQNPDAIRAAFAELDRRVGSVAGVAAASLDIGSPPFLGGSSSVNFWRADQPPPEKEADGREAIFHAVGPDHFTAMGIPVQRGRSFSRLDDARTMRVMVVDEELARTMFPNEDAVGQRIKLTAVEGEWHIVGVVQHVRHWGVDRDDTARVRAQLYLPYAQIPDIIAPMAAGAIGGVVRATAPVADVLDGIRREVVRFDAGQAVREERLMTEVIDESLAGRRFALVLLGGFAAAALALAVIGTYGVMAFIAGRRTAEIGVRMAVGATATDIVRLLLGAGGNIVVAGLLIGLPIAWAAGRLIAEQLYGVRVGDPLTFISVSGVLASTVLAACGVVARRASRIDPVVALRLE